MEDKYDLIEKLNLDYINVKNSKEYLLGNKIYVIVRYLKKFKFISLFKKIIDTKKINKYNSHNALDNNFNEKKDIKTIPKIVVYTCITDNYDKKILEPWVNPKNIDYYLFTDNENIKTDVWSVKRIPDNIKDLDNVKINRYIKMHPFELFNNYDYAIYIDGNVQVVSNLTKMVYSIDEKVGIAMHKHQFRDCIYNEIEVCKIRKKGNYNKMKLQTENYKKEGFPKHFGMIEATIIVSNTKNDIAKKIFNDWWSEFLKFDSHRDQISLQYVVWKNNLKIEDLGKLGNNLYKNPKFRINIH